MAALLAVILAYVAVNGVSALSVDFFTQAADARGRARRRHANAIVGTLIVVGLASPAWRCPSGSGAGIYLAEFGDNRFGDVVRFVADVLSGVPSIVDGHLRLA